MREMKDSGVPWIGEIPKDWTIRQANQVFTESKRLNDGLVEKNLLSLSYGKIVRKNIDTSFGLLPESFEGYNIIDKDMIVLRLTDLQNDQRSLRVGFANERGIITSAYLSLRCKSNDEPKYLYYLLHCFDIVKGFYGMGGGIRQGLTWEGIKNLRFYIPSSFEQRRIADFLDVKCAEIDSILEQTKTSIEEYKALKQSVITEAVTKGIRGNRPMKDSGVEWIGEIPEEWRVSTIGRLFIVSAGGDADWNNYSLECDVEHPFPVFTNSLDKNQVYAYTSHPQFSGNSITVTGRGDIGHAIFREQPYDAIIRLLVLEAKDSLSCKYFAYFIDQVIPFFTNSAAVGQLSAVQIQPYRVCLPPVDEQREIADYIEKKCATIESQIVSKEVLISDLEAYKKSLIYEYVTGKKEVV